MNGLRRLIVCTLVGLIVSAAASFAHDETPVVTVSSASFERDVPLAPDAIASGFGEELATVTESAATVPLPTELAGTTVVLTDSTGVERPAQLVFVSAKQVNYLIPAGMATGLAAVRITSGDGDISTGTVDIASVSPGLFTANQTRGGVAVGWAQRVAADGSETFEALALIWCDLSSLHAQPLPRGASTPRSPTNEDKKNSLWKRAFTTMDPSDIRGFSPE